MKTPQIILLTSICFITAGCNGISPPPQEHASASSASSSVNDEVATEPTTIRQSYEVEKVIAIPVKGQHEAVFLGAGDTIHYELPTTSSGIMTGMAIQIGNFGGTSEGTIMVRACQNSDCSEGIAQLAGSVDNAYLPARFQVPLSFSEGLLDVTVIRATGENPFAVWAYPAETEMLLPDGRNSERTLNTEIYVKTQ